MAAHVPVWMTMIKDTAVEVAHDQDQELEAVVVTIVVVRAVIVAEVTMNEAGQKSDRTHVVLQHHLQDRQVQSDLSDTLLRTHVVVRTQEVSLFKNQSIRFFLLFII